DAGVLGDPLRDDGLGPVELDPVHLDVTTAAELDGEHELELRERRHLLLEARHGQLDEALRVVCCHAAPGYRPDRVIAWRAMSECDGQVAIVTGAASGVGRETVRLLHEAGASVVAEDRNPAVAELETGDGRIVAVVGDVADAATAEAAVATAIDRFGHLD